MTEPVGRCRVVVVGANAAGMSAAHQALRRAEATGRRIEVVVVEATQDTSYSACGIPYWLAGDVDDDSSLVARTAADHRGQGIDLVLGARVTEIDRAAMTVTYDQSGAPPTRLAYDDLVLATGASPIVPRWAVDDEGALLTGVHPVKSLEDGRVWDALLAPDDRDRPQQATVVGGGYIGIEMSEVLLRRGIATRLLTRSRVLGSLDPDMGARVEAVLREGGVDLATQTQITALETTAGRVTAVVTDEGEVLPTELVLLGIGVRPDTGLGRAAGIDVGASGGYLPDPTGLVADHVWAVGDCCEVVNRLTGERGFQPLGTHANKLGRVAGDNLGGGRATFPGIVGSAITRFAHGSAYVEVARTGLSTAESERCGRSVVSLVTEGTTASGYMPEADPIAIKVLADPSSGRLTGMQIVGGRLAGKRIDIAAMALWTGQTVSDVAEADLSYAPPFATAWEITQIACRRLADRLSPHDA